MTRHSPTAWEAQAFAASLPARRHPEHGAGADAKPPGEAAPPSVIHSVEEAVRAARASPLAGLTCGVLAAAATGCAIARCARGLSPRRRFRTRVPQAESEGVPVSTRTGRKAEAADAEPDPEERARDFAYL